MRVRSMRVNEREHLVVHEYDTVDRDLERLGIVIARLPSEAGVVWRLVLSRGELFEAWEPGNEGLSPPGEIRRLIADVVAGKALVPSAPVSTDQGVARLRELLGAQRVALLRHDPGVRLGADPENLRKHRIAARRSRAYLQAARRFVDPDWRESLTMPLRQLGDATGPVRDLDVLLEQLRPHLDALGPEDQDGAATLMANLVGARETARQRLLRALDDDWYRTLLERVHLPPRLRTGVEALPLERVARKEFRALVKAVGRLGDEPTPGALHGLRIVLKRARYAAELSAPTGEPGRAFFEAAKSLQTLLGEHQDAATAESLLRSSTVVDRASAAAFVAGRVAERQVERRARVAGQIPAAWRRLRKRGSKL
jgi:CHAD domain-containing protein